MLPKELVRPALMIKSPANSFKPVLFRRILRIRRRTQLSIAGKVHLLLCLKYSNHPQRVRLTSSMITVRLWPLLRPVLDRMASLSFLRLFFEASGCLPQSGTQESQTPSGASDIHHSRLIRVQGKSSFQGQSLHQSKGLFGFFPAAAQDHKVIRVADHLISGFRHGHVHRMQVKIGQQRAYHSPLRASLLRGPDGYSSRMPCLRNPSISPSTRPSAI